MPRGKYKRVKKNVDAASEGVRLGKTFTPVMVRDKADIISKQAIHIAQLEAEVKRLRLILNLAIEGGVALSRHGQ